MNAVPAAGGGPRVIVNAVGFDADGDGDTAPDANPPVPAAPGNGHDTVCHSGGDGTDDPLALPAFLRRS